jgi:hypothetical protein
MARNFSPFITNFFAERASLDARAYNTHLALEIILGNDAVLRYASGDVVLTTLSKNGASITLDEPFIFDPKILQTPTLQFSQANQSDGSTPFDITNLDYLLSALIPDENKLFRGAKITVYLCFPKNDGTYEGVIWGKGNVRQNDADEETAQISFISDLSDQSITAGGAEITQKCLNIFGVNEGTSWCGATGFPVDSTCTKVFNDKTNGCAFWGQQHAFKGVSFFNPNVVSGYSGTPTGGGGFDIPPTNCVDPKMYFKSLDRGWILGNELIDGETLVDLHGNNSTIEKVERFWAEYRYKVISPLGFYIICSASHPFQTSFDDIDGTAISSLIADQNPNSKFAKIIEQQTGKPPAQLEMPSVEIVAQKHGVNLMSKFGLQVAAAGWVLRLSLLKNHLFLAGNKPNFGFGCHNQKPIYTII